MKKAFRPAFTATIPVLCGYLFIGFAFGVMLRDIGFGSIWSFFCSLSIYAGSGQYLLVSLLAAKASLVTVAVMTLLLNCRHIFYGLSFLETFHEMGRRKWYMIFSLTDETYSLLCSVKTPEGIDAGDMRFWIAMLDHSYWILGGVLGTIIGGILPFDTTGRAGTRVAVRPWAAIASSGRRTPNPKAKQALRFHHLTKPKHML